MPFTPKDKPLPEHVKKAEGTFPTPPAIHFPEPGKMAPPTAPPKVFTPSIGKLKEIATKKLSSHAEGLRGGLADGTPDRAYDAKQLAQGIAVEREHVDNPALQKEIAKDHLAEHPHYYTALHKMEKRLENMKDAAYHAGVTRAMRTLF